MKLKCVDGIVRKFGVAREDGKMYGIVRQEGYTEVYYSPLWAYIWSTRYKNIKTSI